MENNEDKNWKLDLRDLIIKTFDMGAQANSSDYSKIGEYYLGYAKSSLYKYFSDNEKNVNNLLNNKLWYSAPIMYNDVFDSSISVNKEKFFDMCFDLAPDGTTIMEGSKLWKDCLKKFNSILNDFKNTYKNSRENTGIACFSETYDNLLMWAHYAKNHKGFCAEYEMMEINNQLNFTPAPIIYSNKRVDFNKDVIQNPNEGSIRMFIESLTTKSLDWSYENEWRIIRDNVACGEDWDDEQNGALLNMIIPSSIILGCKTNDKLKDKFLEYCKHNNVNLYQMRMDDELYKLNREVIFEIND